MMMMEQMNIAVAISAYLPRRLESVKMQASERNGSKFSVLSTKRPDPWRV